MKILQAILVLAGTALFFITQAHNGPDRREWTMRPADDSATVQFGMEYRSNYSRWSHNSPVAWSQFKGITRDDVSKLSTPAKFEVRRDAGRLICEGNFHLGRGSGSYNFEIDPKYKEELAKLGFQIAGNKQEIEYFMADLTLDFARAVKEADVRASSEDLFDMRIHGLSKAYLVDMRAAGYDNLAARDYIELKIHGVDAQFLADLKRAGYNLDADRIIELKNHGVNRSYIQQLASYGLRPDAGDLIQLKSHGVEPEYLRALKEAGYANLDADQITQLKAHGVPAGFIREARELGYNFTAQELTEMRNHGVEASYLRRLKNSGFQGLTADKITQLKIHGVD